MFVCYLGGWALISKERVREEQQPPKRGTCRSCAQDRKKTLASVKCYNCQTFACKRHPKKNGVCLLCEYRVQF